MTVPLNCPANVFLIVQDQWHLICGPGLVCQEAGGAGRLVWAGMGAVFHLPGTWLHIPFPSQTGGSLKEGPHPFCVSPVRQQRLIYK